MTFIVDTPYIARYDKRIRFNGKTNDRCAADRELEIRGTLISSPANTIRWGGGIYNVHRGNVEHSDVKLTDTCATRDIIRCVMCSAQYARLVYYSDILLMSVLSDYSCIHVHVH